MVRNARCQQKFRGIARQGCLFLNVLLAICSLAVLTGAVQAATAPPAMIAPGQFSVSATGAATYTMPIAVPPGSAGMVPALSFDYSSQNGDGIVGLGWTLNGLPSINRCPRTWAQDGGVHGGVNYNSGDRLCLEGQRLIYVSGGTGYGSDSSQYRTEIESFSKIVEHDGMGTSNAWFEVWTKSGQHMEFGNSADSQVLTVGLTTPVIRAWAVNKISDSVGNYLTVTYNCAPIVSSACTDTDRTTYGESYPLEIDYTGNASAGVSPYNKVKFLYLCRDGVGTCRADTTPMYQAGASLQLTVLLSNVQTYQGSNLVYDYQLAYPPATDPTTHSHLTQIQLCDGSLVQKCLAATTFGWQGGASLPTMTAVPNGIAQGKYIHYGNGTFFTAPGLSSPDFNGDGLTDVLVNVPMTSGACISTGAIYLGTAAGTFNTANATVTYTTPFSPWQVNGSLCTYAYPLLTPWVIDIDSNGKSDLLSINLSTNQNQYLINNGSQVFGQSGTTTQCCSWAVADFDGDGRPDIFGQNVPNLYYFLNNGANNFTTQTLSWGIGASGDLFLVGDFDGDGCGDVLSYGFDHQINYAALCNPAAASVSIPNFYPNKNIILGDFNGDGKTDILITPSSGTGAGTLYLSTGTGFVTSSWTVPTDWGKYLIVSGDWNGDGKTDLALIAPGGTGKYGVGTSHAIWLSQGSSFVQAATISNTNSLDTSVSASAADWNNDGAADLWIQKPSGDTEELFSFVPLLMTSVSNGVGSTTTFTYDRINQNTFYTKGTSATFPTQDVDGPLYVVTRVDASNGLGACGPPSSYANCYSSTYTYAGAQTDLQGRGFLGFSTVTITDLQTNVIQTTNYSTTFPYIGLVTSQTKTHSGITLNSVTNTLTNNSGCGVTPSTGVYVVCLTQNVVASNDLNGTAMPTAITSYTYDSDGNALTVNISVSDGSSKSTTNTYSDDTTRWFLGRLHTTAVTSIVGSSNLTRCSSFMYDGSTGLLIQENIEPSGSSCIPGTSAYSVTTGYTYDAFGHRITTTVSGLVIANRTSYAFYDSNGEFLTSAANALGQYEFWAYDARFGQPTNHTGPNFLTTTWTYDSFGRGTLETRPDGTMSAQSYAYCSGISGGTAACPTYGTFLAQTESFAPDGTTQIGPIGTAYYDMLSRGIANDTQGYDGSNIRTATQYDGNGRVQQTSRPYFTSRSTPRWTIYSYDDLGRVILTTFPDASRTISAFNGLTTGITNNLSQTTTTVKNAQGLTASVTDPSGHTTSYVYDAFANALTVTDPSGNVVTNTYDIRGRKIASSDPDMGSWSYTYDVLSELLTQTDAKSQTTTLTYDVLGRVVSRDETGTSGLYSTWTFGTQPANHNVGQLIDAKACTTSSCTTLVSDRTFVYDSLGRPATTTLQTAADYFGYYTTYNANNGKIATVQSPSGFVQRSVYNAYGYLCLVTSGAGTPTCTNSGGTEVFFTVISRDAELHLTQSFAGNGVLTTQGFDPDTGLVKNQMAGPSTGPNWGGFNWGASLWGGPTVAALTYNFDTVGNLVTRTDTDGGYSEGFCYDNLNRLTAYAMGGACASGKTVSYDSLGNITTKSDAGTYSYPSSGSSSVRPHAVSHIVGTVNGVTNPYYNYDSNGNLTCTSTGSGCTGSMVQTVSMTTFNMAAMIAQGSNSVGFTYDSEHARIKQVSIASGITTTTIYLNDPASGALAQRVTIGSGAPTFTDYLMVDGHIVGQRSIQYQSGTAWGARNWNSFNWGSPAGSLWGSTAGTNPPRFKWGTDPWSGPVLTWEYFVLDHLGSMAVITDQGGNVIQRLSYDAWGKQRNSNGTDATCGSITSTTTRGFTNQEQVPIGCLVNLNARLYDPSIGKFLAPDPIVGDPGIPNAFNRYDYVLNNPLSFTDPSGLCFLGCFWKQSWFSPLFQIALAAYGLPALFGYPTTIAGVVANGAIASGITAGVSGGNVLKGAALGGLQAGLFFEAGDFLANEGPGATQGSHYVNEFLAHGEVGGIVSVAGGGNFGSGFLAGGFSGLADSPALDTNNFGANLVEHAVMGGIGSELGGGKFANGAETGAFGYLFNSMLHSRNAVPFKDDQGRSVLDYQGNQMMMPSDEDPHYFVDQGRAAAFGGVSLDGLIFFKQGGDWDIQRVGSDKSPTPMFIDVATVNIGIYSSAAGIPQAALLEIENLYASKYSNFGNAKMNDTYTHLPDRNVFNTELGYRLYQSGSIGPSHN